MIKRLVCLVVLALALASCTSGGSDKADTAKGPKAGRSDAPAALAFWNREPHVLYADGSSYTLKPPVEDGKPVYQLGYDFSPDGQFAVMTRQTNEGGTRVIGFDVYSVADPEISTFYACERCGMNGFLDTGEALISAKGKVEILPLAGKILKPSETLAVKPPLDEGNGCDPGVAATGGTREALTIVVSYECTQAGTTTYSWNTKTNTFGVLSDPSYEFAHVQTAHVSKQRLLLRDYQAEEVAENGIMVNELSSSVGRPDVLAPMKDLWVRTLPAGSTELRALWVDDDGLRLATDTGAYSLPLSSLAYGPPAGIDPKAETPWKKFGGSGVTWTGTLAGDGDARIESDLLAFNGHKLPVDFKDVVPVVGLKGKVVVPKDRDAAASVENKGWTYLDPALTISKEADVDGLPGYAPEGLADYLRTTVSNDFDFPDMCGVPDSGCQLIIEGFNGDGWALGEVPGAQAVFHRSSSGWSVVAGINGLATCADLWSEILEKAGTKTAPDEVKGWATKRCTGPFS